MLKAFRDAPLLQSPDGIRGGYYAYLEAWKYSQDTEVAVHNFACKELSDADLEDWLCREGQFSPAAVTPKRGQLEGGIRLLIAQPQTGFRLAVPTALASSSVLETLNLPDCTFHSFQLASGVFSVHTYPRGSTVDECKRLGLIFRTPQKWECSMGGLSLSHDFETGMTSALLLGYSLNLDSYQAQPPAALLAFIDKIKECRNLWFHPLLLPCLYLVTHGQRINKYTMDDLSHRVVRVEYCVGITQAGRSNKVHLDFPDDPGHVDDEKLFIGDQLQRGHAKKLITLINNISTWIIFAKRSPQWNIDCTNFLTQLLDYHTKLQDYRGISPQVFKETLEYVRNYSEASLEVTQTSEARMALQLNILYTSIAQDDGQISARLAASAGKDSTSMKIIALITAAYLPGTFIATLFSMNMFDWQSGSSGEVSSSFWVYWAVAIPLTIITLVGWGLWWTFEKQRFERDVQQAARQDRPPPKVVQELKSRLHGAGEAWP